MRYDCLIVDDEIELAEVSGAINIQLAVSLPQILLLCVAIIIVAYVVSMLVARRIRKISVYSLITD